VAAGPSSVGEVLAGGAAREELDACTGVREEESGGPLDAGADGDDGAVRPLSGGWRRRTVSAGQAPDAQRPMRSR
jgi:hypothetical protein